MSGPELTLKSTQGLAAILDVGRWTLDVGRRTRRQWLLRRKLCASLNRISAGLSRDRSRHLIK